MTKDSNSQRDRFIETARHVGADEDKAAFTAKLATIAKQKSEHETPHQPKGKK